VTGDESEEESPEEADKGKPDNAQGPELSDGAVESEKDGRERDYNKVGAEPLKDIVIHRIISLVKQYIFIFRLSTVLCGEKVLANVQAPVTALCLGD
jgi:hypothetical protein